jgi:hypothetical protein
LSVDVLLPDGSRHSINMSSPGERMLIEHELHVVGNYSRGSGTLVRFWQGVATLVAELLGTDMAAEAANVLRCENTSEMEDVVKGLAGGEADEKLAEARDRFRLPDEPEFDGSLPVPSPAPEALSASDEGCEQVGETRAGSQPTGGGGGGPTGDAGCGSPTPEGSTFKETEGPAKRSVRRRRLVVTGASGSSSGHHQGPLATEEVTFAVVEAYEEACSPKRYPIRVSHIRGQEGFGCDILSVRTEVARRRAMHEGVVNSSDILRFIEVKGSSSRTGMVELTENEFDRAEREKARYFVYRVFCDREDPGRYELAVLGDPVHSDAVRRITRFDLGDGSGASWYRMETREEQVDDGKE